MPFSVHFSLSLTTHFRKSSHAPLAKHFFTELDRSLYHDHFKIFTDGSLLRSPRSASAAVFFEDLSLCQSWRLGPYHYILAAELVAIYMALLFLRDNLPPQKVVLFSDSQTSLFLLQAPSPSSHRTLVFAIQDLVIRLLESGWVLHFQWVPSHCGIIGNDIADKAAGHAHSRNDDFSVLSDTSYFQQRVRAECRAQWDGDLGWTLPATHLGLVRMDSSPHPWARAKSRALDVALTRLRIGHTRLASYLHRLRMVPDDCCRWCGGAGETLLHFLTVCPRFHSHRVRLLSSLRSHGIQPSLPVLLGGTTLPPDLRPLPPRLLGAFLQSTGLTAIL